MQITKASSEDEGSMIIHRRHLAYLLPILGLFVVLAFSQPGRKDLGIIRLRYATIVVRDYDQALHWYTGVLGFEKTEDGIFGEGKRWLVVAPRGSKDFGIILEIAKPISPNDPVHNYDARVGTEKRWVFEVEDCRKFYAEAS